METASKAGETTTENSELLLQIEVLVIQLTDEKIPINEGYERLITLVYSHIES